MRERHGLLRRRTTPASSTSPDDTGWAAVAPRRRLGVQAIAVASIAGTTDPHKAAAFDRELRPPQWSRERWKQLYVTAQRGTPLPPVSVYRVGDRHFLRDGHHRVSVARAIGADAIDAHVVELLERVRLERERPPEHRRPHIKLGGWDSNPQPLG